jgi:hypothetical protein
MNIQKRENLPQETIKSRRAEKKIYNSRNEIYVNSGQFFLFNRDKIFNNRDHIWKSRDKYIPAKRSHPK